MQWAPPNLWNLAFTLACGPALYAVGMAYARTEMARIARQIMADAVKETMALVHRLDSFALRLVETDRNYEDLKLHIEDVEQRLLALERQYIPAG